MVVITIEELELNNNFAAAKNWMGAEYNNDRPFTFFFLLYGPIWQIAKCFFYLYSIFRICWFQFKFLGLLARLENMNRKNEK